MGMKPVKLNPFIHAEKRTLSILIGKVLSLLFRRGFGGFNIKHNSEHNGYNNQR